MQNVILTVHLILALCLVGVVLLQRSEGGGLGMGGGGGGAMSGRAAATALTKLTWIFAALFIVTSVTLTVFSARNATGSSVIDQFGGTAPDAPAAPLGTDLLPPAPVSTDGALTPPRADTPAPETTAPVTPVPDAPAPEAATPLVTPPAGSAPEATPVPGPVVPQAAPPTAPAN